VTRLCRVGYDKTVGYLEGGMDAWKAAGKDVDTLESITAEEFSNRFKKGNLNILDVRKDGEFASSHIENAQHFALDYINDKMNEVSKNKTYHIHCAGGYRSVIAASILKARGFNNIVDIAGGFGAIKNTDLPITDFVCPSTL